MNADDLARALRPRKHSVPRVFGRFVAGRPLNGSAAPYLTPGGRRWPGWKRQVARLLGTPTAVLAGLQVIAHPRASAAVVAVLVLALIVVVSRKAGDRRFQSVYVTPTLAAIKMPLGLDSGVTLRVDRELGSLVAKLARPLSPAEKAAREWYGTWLEPVLRWLPDRLQRGVWAIGRTAEPAIAPFRRPAPEWGPRIELRAERPYVTAEQITMINGIVSSKIPVSDTAVTWDQVGRTIVARWTVRKRPPAKVGYAEVKGALGSLSEWEFFVGRGAGSESVVLSLKDDSPHIAVSAGSGAGKSVLAQLLAVQVLRRGGQVVILDRKGSHRWAIGLDGVDYCSRPEQMHEALIRLAALADERNTLAFHEADDWDCGPRTLVICEELNATFAQLGNYWAEVREKGQPKKSPAISGLADLLFMGRSAKINVVAIAQMLSARAIGGPEARENFGIRCLARYTANAWKMLVPEAAMPRSSRTLGRWQIVVGGQAVECQVAYLTVNEARALAKPETDLVDGLSSDVPASGDMLTLRDAIDDGVLPWSFDAAKKRLQRGVGRVPTPRGKRGNADLYVRDDLRHWVDSA